jgi:hypothetical protein
MAIIDPKTVFQNIIIGLVVAAGLFFSILLLNFSWIKIVVVTLILVSGIIWMVSQGNLKKSMKYLVLSFLIFGIFFASFERYIFWNTGYLSTYNPSLPDVTVSYPSLLTVPLTELVQSAKETYAFNLFRLEYFGDISFESILLSTTYPDGRIEITFYNENANMGFGFRSSSGSPFVASNIPWIGHPPSRLYSGQQTPEETLKQIDDLGLQWFFDRVVEEYQNRAGTHPNTSSLDVNTQWQEYGDYSGLILEMTGWQQNNNVLQDVFHAAFQPNGTLFYMNFDKSIL